MAAWTRVVREVLAARRARREYAAADVEAGRLLDDLERGAAQDAYGRMLLLYALANAERTMASGSWAVDGDRDEDGHTLAESHEAAARLIGAVAESECALAEAWTHPPVDLAAIPARLAAVEVLTCLGRESELATRAALVVRLYVAVVDTVSGYAGEALIGVAVAYYVLSGLSWQDAVARCRIDGGDA